MAGAEIGLGEEEEKIQESEDPEEDESISLRQIYSFIYSEPDASLGIILSLIDILIEKGLFTEEDLEEVLRRGLERWIQRA